MGGAGVLLQRPLASELAVTVGTNVVHNLQIGSRKKLIHQNRIRLEVTYFFDWEKSETERKIAQNGAKIALAPALIARSRQPTTNTITSAVGVPSSLLTAFTPVSANQRALEPASVQPVAVPVVVGLPERRREAPLPEGPRHAHGQL